MSDLMEYVFIHRRPDQARFCMTFNTRTYGMWKQRIEMWAKEEIGLKRLSVDEQQKRFPGDEEPQVWYWINKAHLNTLISDFLVKKEGLPVLLEFDAKRSSHQCDTRCQEALEDECVCSCAGLHHGGSSGGISWKQVGTRLYAGGELYGNYKWTDPSEETQAAENLKEIRDILINSGVSLTQLKVESV